MSLLWPLLAVFGLLPAFYLGLLALVARCQRKRPPEAKAHLSIAIVVPAHDEASQIGDTVKNLLAQDYPREAFAVHVIADNCSDDTARLAKSAGARVWERSGEPGKGQALHAFFQRLLKTEKFSPGSAKEKWDAVLVVDADSHLHSRALTVCNNHLQAGARALQLRYGVLNPEAGWRSRMLEWSLASFNGLRPCGKATLGLSAGIVGNGFCLARKTLEEVPYLAGSIVEDLEYHLMLLSAGIRVAFDSEAWVKAKMPTRSQGANTQRVRWERGRWQMIRQHLWPLLKRLLKGDWTALDGLVDLLPPVSLAVLALLLGLLGTPGQRLFSILGLLTIIYHYFEAARRFGSLAALPGIAIHLPYYLLQKTWVVFSSLLRQRRLGWHRTERD